MQPLPNWPPRFVPSAAAAAAAAAPDDSDLGDEAAGYDSWSVEERLRDLERGVPVRGGVCREGGMAVWGVVELGGGVLGRRGVGWGVVWWGVVV